MHTFEVSDVPLCSERLTPMEPHAAVGRRLRTSFEACGCNLSDLVTCEPREADRDEVPGDQGNDLHPFLAMVHYAFAEHYPLVLSPDDVWLCIAQGFALHVDLNAEALRGRFVRHEGKEKIKIRRDDIVKGSPDNDWPGCFAQFSDGIAEHIGKKRDLVVADFSTTGPVEKAASEVVLMAAMQHYFDSSLLTYCGIPRVTLLGTVDDWKSIRRRATVLSELDLGWWVDALVPLLDELVAAASGRPDRKLWQSLYKLDDNSGGPHVTGWINVLFPYIDREAPVDVGALAALRRAVVEGRRAAVDREALKPRQERVQNPFVTSWPQSFDHAFGGPNTGQFTSGLSMAPFTWEFLSSKYPMQLVAGFVGVSQDEETLAVRPAIGWAVTDAPA